MAFFTEFFSRPRPAGLGRIRLPTTAQFALTDPDMFIPTVRPADFPRLPRRRTPQRAPGG